MVSVNASACTKGADCAAQQVCCGALGLAGAGATLTTACQASPCASQLLIGAPIQLCARDAECPAGSTCQPPPAAYLALAPGVASYRFCAPAPPPDGGGADTGPAARDAGAADASGDATLGPDATAPVDATADAGGGIDAADEGDAGSGDSTDAGDTTDADGNADGDAAAD
ncbi:MAG: hypothetical protein JOZ69_19445 [Myxococcales bacterium]|nr:hypothetical protein [Myxococcales bacterium]